MDVDETELLKLCLSRTVNLLNPEHVASYTQFIPASTYNELLQTCTQMNPLRPALNLSAINKLFDELLQFQFDKDEGRLLGHLDEKKNTWKKTKNQKIISCYG